MEIIIIMFVKESKELDKIEFLVNGSVHKVVDGLLCSKARL